jgi:Uma2 family endonuclease
MVTAVSWQEFKSPQGAIGNGMVLRRIAWDTYQALVCDLESQPCQRLTYDCGLLEIWMPLPPHERYKKVLGRVVEIVTEELGIEVCSLGSTTWRRKDLAKGVEPDECYYIQHEPMVRGRVDIDLTVDPPPDLVIEVDMTSVSVPRLPIYQVLGVPEVWRFDGERIKILSLAADEYREIEESLVLPMVKVEALQDFMEQVLRMGETSWAKQVRQWVRQQVAQP